MITKEKLGDLIMEHNSQQDRIDILTSIFPEAYSANIIDWGCKMFDELIRAYFTEEGVDWISYFLYENPNNEYVENGRRMKLETIDDLWSLVKDYRK